MSLVTFDQFNTPLLNKTNNFVCVLAVRLHSYSGFGGLKKKQVLKCKILTTTPSLFLCKLQKKQICENSNIMQPTLTKMKIILCCFLSLDELFLSVDVTCHQLYSQIILCLSKKYHLSSPKITLYFISCKSHCHVGYMIYISSVYLLSPGDPA